MRKKFKEATGNTLAPLRPHLKWLVVGFAIVISFGSILYTNSLVEQIRDREQRQIEIYASSLEFLANESENVNFFLILDEIVAANHSIPVILTDENEEPEDFRNLEKAERYTPGDDRMNFLRSEIQLMKEAHPPIEVTLKDDQDNIYGHKYIFYKNSFLLNQLRYYPYIQLSVIGLFGVVIFMVLNYIKRVEQDRVWVGLAKETAHQLGTPLSSLMAWSEYFKDLYPDQKEALLEFDKDVDRLKVITDRFSSIGSEPQLSLVNVADAIDEIVIYLQKRLSTKINMTVSTFPNREIDGRINPSLFAWVIENLCKNAADAMEGKGSIHISILRANEGRVAVDVQDTGKGIAKAKVKNVFRPGFTTKKRGWGLGLTLAKRIIEQYHQGKIFVKHSEINKGTTFRIYLNG
ncbi:Histidine kinase-, DNA gyrase B-, and HSP90-like ATPase [Ekhidna lutea]|uniref:histidine kinase n=1 Tax=Ekhidna lutea TaxID=447679 RepID=A0A239IXJ9_EKHLU|nr:ATP-binding protein [Ekhidna lutea]SNS97753.1 Histidine kinase-, DNA gyrase B-, and HSP90-like ATPase [Ekhidna lutea]